MAKAAEPKVELSSYDLICLQGKIARLDFVLDLIREDLLAINRIRSEEREGEDQRANELHLRIKNRMIRYLIQNSF